MKGRCGCTAEGRTEEILKRAKIGLLVVTIVIGAIMSSFIYLLLQ